MKQRAWFLLTLLVVVVLGGGYYFLNEKILVLQLENKDRTRTMSIRIRPLERFSIYYIHSIHQEPLIEEFEAAPDNTIVLKDVRTKSPALAEAYGLDERKGTHSMDERLGAIFFRVAPGEGQGLIVQDRKIYLNEIGRSGDRIQLSVRSVSRASYLLARLSQPSLPK